MSTRGIYIEKIHSNKTELLFIALTLLFLSLSAWRIAAWGVDFLAGVFLFFSGVFLFYSINYRTLNLRLSPESLALSFGIFTWTLAVDNIASIQPDDDLPPLMKYGGAGIHFMFVRQRYRASFNFLEYPRLVIALRRKAGMVRDISFSTSRPDELRQLIQAAVAANTLPPSGDSPG
jgi:hypothetical protein